MIRYSKIMLALISILVMSYSVFSCPNWLGSELYMQGDKIVYEDVIYEAVREIPLNTPPQASDNGWFWIETDVECNDKILLEANSFEVITEDEPPFKKTVIMNSEGLNIKKINMGGFGGRGVQLGYDNLSLHASGSRGLVNCSLKPNSITLHESQVGQKPEYTTLTSSSIMTSGTIKTDSKIECNDIILRNVNLVNKIIELEARLAELETK